MSDDLHQLLSEWFEHEQKKRKKLFEKYPQDVSNSECLHAYIKGINIENSFNPSVGARDIHFDLERKRTIDAQCFSAIILRGYIDKHVKILEDALDALHFNLELLSLVDDNLITKMTKND